MKKVIYSSPFIPAEWIAAHGFTPSRRTFIKSGQGPCSDEPINVETGVCPYMRSFVNQAIEEKDVAAIVLTSTCDQMRRGADLVNLHTRVPCFLMHVPSTWGTPETVSLYTQELERLGRFLIDLGAAKPQQSELASYMIQYEIERIKLLSRNEGLPANNSAHVSIGLIGGPLSVAHSDLFDVLGEYGASVVVNGSETGERTFPKRFDLRRLREEPMQVMAEAYFGSIPDIFERPNNRIFLWLKEKIEDHNLRGIVLIRYVWCDKWHAEVQRFREWLSIPLLDVELDAQMITQQTRNRIQAFMEAVHLNNIKETAHLLD